MILYIVVILLGMTTTALINVFVWQPVLNFPLWFNILGVVCSTIAVIAVHGASAAICHAFQKKLKPFSKYFNVTRKQKNILSALGVKRFKKHLPDLGFLVKFPKAKIADPKSKEYIYLYMLESCSGELGHTLAIFLGYLIIFIFPLKYYLCFGIPIATINAVLAILPILSLRFNRYSLGVVYKRLERAEKTNEEVLQN